MQQDAYRLFEFLPDRTLDICQKLYETYKCLSYPRTGNQVMGVSDTDLVKSVFVSLSAEYEQLALGAAIPDSSNKRVFSREAFEGHHALIPLRPLINCSSDERRIFNLIVKNFFAAFYPGYIRDIVHIYFDIGGFAFLSDGKRTKQRGWKELYTNDFAPEELLELFSCTIHDTFPGVT